MRIGFRSLRPGADIDQYAESFYTRTFMKRLEAIIKPFQIDPVLEALTELGVGGATTIDVLGFGRQKGHTEIYRGSEYTNKLLPKKMIIIYIPDDQVDAVVKAIQKAAYTGKIGDGKIAIMDVENLLRIRTGEQGGAAL